MYRRCCCKNDCKLYPGFTYEIDGLTVSFTNTSTTDFPPMTYLWDFGDGTTSTETNPTHTYDEPGIYPVILTVTNAISCIRTSFQPVDLSIYVPCPQCITGFAPNQVVVQIPSGTSIWGCQFCINLAGIYILNSDSNSCTWFYSEFKGLCQVCSTPPSIRNVRLDITLRLIENPLGGFGNIIELTVNLVITGSVSTDDNCPSARGLFRKQVTFPISCTSPTTVPISTFIGEQGSTLVCRHGTEATVFL